MANQSAVTMVPTQSASRYLQQLCKHWSHNLAVSFTPQQGSITFPANGFGKSYPADGVVKLQARDEALEVVVDASAPEQLEGLKGAVASHLDRFAFREAPLQFDWR